MDSDCHFNLVGCFNPRQMGILKDGESRGSPLISSFLSHWSGQEQSLGVVVSLSLDFSIELN